MSNIRPIGDPTIATAMLATMQSIDAVRSASSGISEPRWRILQCIAKAAPNVPSPGELRMCSGLNKAALAEHVQALQWKGLLEMGGYRLSPSAAAMGGIDRPYAPKDAKAMVIVEHGPRDDDAVVALQHALAAMGVKDMSILPPEPIAPVFIGVDIAAGPDVSIEARVTFGADGKIAKIEPLTPMDPADVPACMRPDCTAPETPIETSSARPVGSPVQPPLSNTAELPAPSTGRRSGPESSSVSARAKVAPRISKKPRPVGRDTAASAAPAPVIAAPVPANPAPSASDETHKHGRGSAAVARPRTGAVLSDRVATDRITEVVAGSNPAPGQPTKSQISAPPATPPKFTNWIEERARRLDAAIRFLKTQAILVSVVDRDAQVRQYFVAGKRDRKFAEEVIEIAIEKGWVE